MKIKKSQILKVINNNYKYIELMPVGTRNKRIYIKKNNVGGYKLYESYSGIVKSGELDFSNATVTTDLDKLHSSINEIASKRDKDLNVITKNGKDKSTNVNNKIINKTNISNSSEINNTNESNSQGSSLDHKTDILKDLLNDGILSEDEYNEKIKNLEQDK